MAKNAGLAENAMEARGAVEAEMSDPRVNRRWRAVHKISRVMNALPSLCLMRMDDDDAESLT